MSETSETTRGHRRIDRILDPSFVEGLEDLSTEDLRRRRDECHAEREYRSLLRRLVQGRLDILRSEAERRRSGGDEASLVEGLARALTPDGPSGPSRGEALTLLVPPEEMTLARRRVESLVADTGLSDPRSLPDDDLESAIAALETEERNVSADRGAVMAVYDRLQDELKRRYRADPTQALA
jgi:hypothetical protein